MNKVNKVRTFAIFVILAMLFSFANVGPAAAAGPSVELAKLTAGDGAADDTFGRSVALDGNTALVGATGYDGNIGSAYVFTWSGTEWVEEAKLTASDGVANDKFGSPVALDGDTALVAAQVDNLFAGAVYVFTWSGTEWVEEAKLTASDAAMFSFFGCSVALDGDTALVGSFAKNRVYVFTRTGTTWHEEAILTSEAILTANDGFWDGSLNCDP